MLGSHGQLEQVFLNLFVHAEQSLAQAEQKSLTIRTSVLARRLLVEISFTAPAELRKPEDTAAVLGVTRSVIAGHGGEVRLIEKARPSRASKWNCRPGEGSPRPQFPHPRHHAARAIRAP